MTTATLRLSNGYVVKIGEDCLPLVSSHSWHGAMTSKRKSPKIYAMRAGNGRTTYLHRLIIGAKRGEIVDHINGDTLDNRRANLRIATHAQNAINCSSPRPYGFRGIERRPSGKFNAQISVNRKSIRSRRFFNIEDAAREYDRLARQYHGEILALDAGACWLGGR